MNSIDDSSTCNHQRVALQPLISRLRITGHCHNRVVRARTPGTHRLRQPMQKLDRGAPVDATVGDTLAIARPDAWHEVLPSADKLALDHHPHDAATAALDLPRHRFDDLRLVVRVVTAV